MFSSDSGEVFRLAHQTEHARQEIRAAYRGTFYFYHFYFNTNSVYQVMGVIFFSLTLFFFRKEGRKGDGYEGALCVCVSGWPWNSMLLLKTLPHCLPCRVITCV